MKKKSGFMFPQKWLLYAFVCLLFYFCKLSGVFSQTIYSGVVRGEKGDVLEGVTVTIVGKPGGVLTNREGVFKISAYSGEYLNFSNVGYARRQVKLNDNAFIGEIAMYVLAINLDAIVVTGYTSQRVKDIAGAVSIVKPKDLVSIPEGTVGNMLQGRSSGLNVITSGEPGEPARITIRGLGNFGDARPLFIIDGIQGNADNLNAYDIESIQVLKDAASYSIYGVRGANGVIVITTKKGKPGKLRIDYDMYLGYQIPLKGPDLLNPQETADLYWLTKRNSGDVDANGNPNDVYYGNDVNPVLPDYIYAGGQLGVHEGDPAADPSKYNMDPDAGDIYQIVSFDKKGTDWYHELYKPAFSQNHTVTISGAGDDNHYLVSLGYLDQQGTLLNTYLKRYTARINTEFSYKKNFHFGENIQVSYSQNPKAYRYCECSFANDDLNEAITFSPAQPVYDINGNWNGVSTNPQRGVLFNPVARRTQAANNKTRNWGINGNLFASLDFLKYFSFNTRFGGTVSQSYNLDFYPGSFDRGSFENQLSESSGYLTSLTFTNTFNFSKEFGEHNVKALAGFEYISNKNREVGGKVQGLPFEDPDFWLLSNGDPQTQTNYSVAGSSTIASLLSRLEYSFEEKYILTATLRRDGSSVFGPINRYGWFPSFALAWRMTEEKFMAATDWITDLKWRVSWGKTGFYGNTDPLNQFSLYGGNAGNAFYDIYGNSSGSIQRGYYRVRIGNPRTGWQEDVLTNIGMDAVLWNGKLTITADWYNKRSKGLLFPVALPDLLGDATPPNVNSGDISNKGIDLSLGSKGTFNKDWSWDILATFSGYKNRILKLNEIPYFDDVFGIVRNEVGYPIGSFFGYKVIGIFRDDGDVQKSPEQPDAAPGRFKYLDVTGVDANGSLTGIPDGKINQFDRVHYGNPHPDFTLGLNIALSFRNFDFSTYFYGSFGNDVIYGLRNRLELAPFEQLGAYGKPAYYQSWTPERKDAQVPVAELSYNAGNKGVFNSFAVVDGTYFRNKSLMVGYTFPRNLINRIGLQKLRIYLQVTNLFTITNYPGLDPEVYGAGISPLSASATPSSFGIDFGTYPTNQKEFVFGLNLSL